MYTRRWCVPGFIAAGLLCAEGPQPSIQVTGAVKEPLTLTVDELSKMPRASVRTKSTDGEIVYEGVPLHEILKRAGIPQGEALRGKALAGYVLASAQDGYHVVFSLAETHPGFTDNDLLVADRADGKPLSGNQGRFRLVAP